MAKRRQLNSPKPRNDAYTMMLFVTLLAIVGGCVLLYLDFDDYKDVKPQPTQALTIPKLGAAADITAPAAPAAPMAPAEAPPPP